MSPLYFLLTIAVIAIIVIILIALLTATKQTPASPEYQIIMVGPENEYELQLGYGVMETYALAAGNMPNNSVRMGVSYSKDKLEAALNTFPNVAPSKTLVFGGFTTKSTLELYGWLQQIRPGAFLASVYMTATVEPSEYPYLIKILPDNNQEAYFVMMAMVARSGPQIQPGIIFGATDNNLYATTYRDNFIRHVQVQNPEWTVPVIPLTEWVGGERFSDEVSSVLALVNSGELVEIYPTLPSTIDTIATDGALPFRSPTPLEPGRVFIAGVKTNTTTEKQSELYLNLKALGLNDATYPISQAAYYTADFFHMIKMLIERNLPFGWSGDSFTARYNAHELCYAIGMEWYAQDRLGQPGGTYSIVNTYDTFTQEEVATFRERTQGSSLTLSQSRNVLYVGGVGHSGPFLNAITTFPGSKYHTDDYTVFPGDHGLTVVRYESGAIEVNDE